MISDGADFSRNVIQVSRQILIHSWSLIRRMMLVRRGVAVGFFKGELGPVERFENALKEKQAARERLARQLAIAQTILDEKRTLAGRLAVAGASNIKLERAETKMRAVEERVRMLRSTLAEFDEQIGATERALIDARAQRDRKLMADQIEAMAAAIEQAAPAFGAGAAALVEAVTKSAVAVAEATRFAASVDAVRREVLSATDLVCWELRTIAVRTRAGNVNSAPDQPVEAERPPPAEIDRQLIYTLNPLRWREGSELRRAPAFVVVELPKALLPIALRHQHVDYLNARRVHTLMHVHGSGAPADPADDDPQLVDLDALAKEEVESAQADVA
jgi:hypothetical protein